MKFCFVIPATLQPYPQRGPIMTIMGPQEQLCYATGHPKAPPAAYRCAWPSHDPPSGGVLPSTPLHQAWASYKKAGLRVSGSQV